MLRFLPPAGLDHFFGLGDEMSARGETGSGEGGSVRADKASEGIARCAGSGDIN
jgi:hypothetical protein